MRTRPQLVAMLCAAAIGAEFIGGKATRDALFLTSLGATALPGMLIVTAVCSILLVALHARAMGGLTPARVVPASFALSGALFIIEWLIRPVAPSAVATLIYLHVSAAGPLLASGFWLVAGERFDPRTAKARFGQIGGAGTLGGLIGAVVAERVAVHFGAPLMLLLLGVLQFAAAWLVWVLADAAKQPASSAPETRLAPQPLITRLRVIAGAPHLRDLMALVVLGTTSAALLEYVFKTRAVDTFGPGDGLLRFFALFYGASGLVSFAIQMIGSSAAFRRSGLALSMSSPSIALVAGSLGGLIAPGFGSLAVARAGESIFRASWFRAGYELFFTPMQPEEKRTAKPFIDVVLDRLGDAIGGGIIRLVVVFVPLSHSMVLLWAAIACSLGAMVAASHLHRWYVRALENSLVNQGGDIDWPPTQNGATIQQPVSFHREMGPAAEAARAELADIRALRLGGRDQVHDILSRPEGPPAGLVPHIIPLLAVEPVADQAMLALRKVADGRVGELIDALLNPSHDATIRRRLARVLSTSVSQRAADGLLLALDDKRPDVRRQAARSLAAILLKNPQVRMDRARIEDVVRQEVEVSGTAREGGRQNLAHVFTLLSLILPREPLQIAFRSLTGTDQRLRGTALEYLEEVLPGSIRQSLLPLINADTVAPRTLRQPVAIPNRLRTSPPATLTALALKQA